LSYKRISPQPVVEGGTGVQANTAYTVLCGGTTTTNPIQSIASVGTSGQVLTSNGAGALPTFQPSASAGITSITGTTGGAQTGPAITLSGGTTGLAFGGSANTFTTTFAGITANGGTVSLATDATTSTVNVGTGAGNKTVSVGSTNTTSATTISSGTGNIIHNTGLTIDSTGRTLNAVQPAFAAFKSAASTNVTGDGTVYTVIFDTVYFDQGSNYNATTGVFTAPITGKYLFTSNVEFINVIAVTQIQLNIAGTFGLSAFSIMNGSTATATGFLILNGSVLVPMTAGQTCSMMTNAQGTTKTVGVNGNGGSGGGGITSFTGYLVC